MAGEVYAGGSGELWRQSSALRENTNMSHGAVGRSSGEHRRHRRSQKAPYRPQEAGGHTRGASQPKHTGLLILSRLFDLCSILEAFWGWCLCWWSIVLCAFSFSSGKKKAKHKRRTEK